MAYDGARQQVVMFGGAVPSPPSFVDGSDMWLWDGQNWHATSPSTVPPPRDRACMIYDPRIQKIVMFGGEYLSQFGDTWLWDGANWTLQDTSAGAPPAGTCYSRFGYDELRHQAILVTLGPNPNLLDSSTWSWDGSGWTQLHPVHNPPVIGSGEQMAFDRARGELLLAAYSDNPNNNNFVSTWAWDGSDWIRKAVSGDKMPYDFNPGQAVYDAVHQEVLVFLQFQQTWAWNGTTWSLLTPAAQPSDRILMSMAFDDLHQKVVAFGGGVTFAPFLGADTWVYTDPLQQVQITVPAGVQYTFNGIPYSGSQTIPVAAGTYTLSTTSPQTIGVGTQLVFNTWSDGGAISHAVTVPVGGVSLTGTFGTQYLLTTASNPSSAGSISGGGYYDAGATASPTATPNSGFTFANWSGACSGSGACSVAMNAPATVTANFNGAVVQFTVTVPPAAQFTFNATSYIGPQTIAAPPGPYTLSTTTPQATAAGTQLVFVSWSDGGAISHTVTLSGVAQSITGTFKTQYLLTTAALPVNGGTVVPSSGGPYYDSGTLVNVGSGANVGFQFEYWSGACVGSALVCQVLMNAPQTVVGNFAVPPKWIQMGPAISPPARYSSSMAFDAGRSEMVLFGGIAGPSYVGDTWAWNGTNWNLRSSAGPSPRAAVALAYDPANAQLVMFGGTTPASSLNETWIWDGNAGVWTQQHPAVSPSPRYFAALAWDGTRLILFGGHTAAGALNDTWAWTGSNWMQLAPATTPLARELASMTYDAARNQVVLFGGQNGGYLGDTWIWNGSNWVAMAPATSPVARSAAAFAYDPVIQQSVLFAGASVAFPDEVWLWDGVNWKSVPESPSPSDRYAGAMAYDPARQQVLLFGGFLSASEGDTWIFANNAVQQFYTLSTAANPVGAGTVVAVSPGQVGPSYRAGSTVALTASSTPAAPFGYWSGACAGQGSGACTLTMLSNLTAIANYPPPPKWISIGAATSPHSRYSSAMAFDAARSELVLFSGGLEEATNHYANETWTWDGTTWTPRFPAVSPSPRSAESMAYDAIRRQVVLFGGRDASAPFGDTWVWDGTAAAWTQRHPAHSPAARAFANLAWDGSRLILFGGSNASGTASADTWAWDGADWTLLTPALSPPARSSAMMTYDPVRLQIVLFGGLAADGLTYLADTWVWDGATWARRNPASSPSARQLAVMAWQGAVQQVVLFSGLSAIPSAETWWWDGNNWILHPETVSPALQWGSVGEWDAARQQLVLFAHYAGDNSELWIYANNAVQQFLTLTTVANPAAGGTVFPAGTQSVRAGALLGLAATPAAGLEFQGWIGGCAGSLRSCNLVLNANTTVTANFGYPLSWLQLNPSTSAPPRGSLILQNPISMAFDVARQQVVYFGGPAGDQTWTWNGATWTKRAPVHSPSARSGHAMAYDAARQRVILFGGGANMLAVNDTWAWDGTDWTLVDSGTGPAKRFNHAMAYDRARQEIVMFGGLDENFNYDPGTWAWTGAQWILRQASGGPPVRSDFGMAFDPVNAEVVLASGFEGQNDTWGWNGSSWTRKFPTHLPSSTLNHFCQMAYDERLQRTVMLMDNYPGAPLTWVWNGLDWSQLSPVQNPAPRTASGIVYDGVRGQVLLFGGDGLGVPLNDTWVLAPPAAILTLQSVSASKNALGNYLVTFALKNTGNATATGVFDSTATAVTLIGGVATTTSTFPLGQFSTILPATSGTFQAQFPATAGAGAHSFSAQGSFGNLGGTGNWSVAVRSVVFP